MLKLLGINDIILVNNKYALIFRDADFEETIDEQLLDMMESGVPGIHDIERIDLFNINTLEYIPCEYREDMDNKLDTKFVFNTDDIVELDSVRLICLYTR